MCPSRPFEGCAHTGGVPESESVCGLMNVNITADPGFDDILNNCTHTMGQVNRKGQCCVNTLSVEIVRC